MPLAHPLEEGGTIGVPAPASPYHNRSEIFRGVEWWESRGYEVKLAPGIFERDMYVAGTPEDRARDLVAMFDDDNVDVVQCLGGGFGAMQTIPHIDFDVIAANPKPFIGYSDITALHTAIAHYTGLVTFYGPGLAGVDDPDRKDGRGFTQDRLMTALTAVDALGEVPRKPGDEYIRPFNGGRVTAELAGGCLWLLGHTIGTPWEVDLAGKIFFFEDVDAPAWYIDGMLLHLRQAGLLDDVVGVVVGELERCDWQESKPEWPQTRSIEDVLEGHLEEMGVPALYGYPLGHGDNLSTLPLGVTATLDADERRLTLDSPALTPQAF